MTTSTRPVQVTRSNGLVIGRFQVPWRAVSMVGAGALCLVAVAVTTPVFFSAGNVRSIVSAAALTGIAAIGLTFVTVSGNFVSLSTGQTVVATSILFALMLRADWQPILAIGLTFLLAAVIGAMQGGVIGLGANPIIVTLAAGAALQGVSSMMTGGSDVNSGHRGVGWLGSTGPFGVAISAYLMVVLAVGASVYLRRHRRGVELALMGESRDAGRATGYSVTGVAITAFVLASLSASLVGVIAVSSFGQASAGGFGDLTFDAVAAVLVGGTAIGGGAGSPARSALGAVFIAMLANFMLLHGWSFGARLAIQGGVVIAAVCVYHVLRAERGTR